MAMPRKSSATDRHQVVLAAPESIGSRAGSFTYANAATVCTAGALQNDGRITCSPSNRACASRARWRQRGFDLQERDRRPRTENERARFCACRDGTQALARLTAEFAPGRMQVTSMNAIAARSLRSRYHCAAAYASSAAAARTSSGRRPTPRCTKVGKEERVRNSLHLAALPNR